MANLSKDIQYASFNHDHYQEAACAYHEEHMMHDCVQLDHVVDSHDKYTSDSNIIMYDQYVRDNEVPVIHSGASSVPTDAFMMTYDDMCEPHDQSVSYPSRNTPALYNGHEIIKENHIQAIVHNSEDTLEIAEITRMKMNDKMNDPECVTRKVKIAPYDYSKDNLLATFTPQKQLTPEQIFWSNDLMKIKSEALKERSKVSRPIKAFTVYPPNTPAALVPKVLPTKSQVKILIFTLIQLFLEFEPTCKKRITPSTITDGEKGFEQTKACYLQEAGLGTWIIPYTDVVIHIEAQLSLRDHLLKVNDHWLYPKKLSMDNELQDVYGREQSFVLQNCNKKLWTCMIIELCHTSYLCKAPSILLSGAFGFEENKNSEGLECPVRAKDQLNKNNKETTIIYLKTPDPVDLYRDKRVPENKEDGWMEVRVWEFVYNNEIKDNYIPMELKL
nr:serine/threonine-protein kinase, active site protein [Tanacetum cinerariifolium]